MSKTSEVVIHPFSKSDGRLHQYGFWGRGNVPIETMHSGLVEKMRYTNKRLMGFSYVHRPASDISEEFSSIKGWFEDV